MAPLTGDDIANLHQQASNLGCAWITVSGMGTRYKLDHHTRTVYVSGRLDLGAYFAAVREGLRELAGIPLAPQNADIIPIHSRRPRTSDTGTG